MCLEDKGFKLKQCDSCVTNKDINGKQCSVCWYVDDNIISHEDPKLLVDSVIEMIEGKFGKMTKRRGKKHTFVHRKVGLNGFHLYN